MNNVKKVLAFDFGASSGRAMAGSFNGRKISLEEIHRFSNDPVYLNGTLYWDTLRQFHEIKQGILNFYKTGRPDSIGIDTWGVDFGLIDRRGYLLENHVHYRDSRTKGMIEEAAKLVPKKEIYNITGTQFMEFNTIFQLLSILKNRPELLERAKTLLLTPDLFNYFLTGEKHTEYTIASTTQLISARDRSISYDLIKRLNIPTGIFTEIIKPGTTAGMLSRSLCDELSVAPAKVIAVASHDTASAVVSVPVRGGDFAYISSGTWSLLGTELDEPEINDESLACNFTNEGGYGGKIRYLKNIVGLWLIQESRRQFIREGLSLSYAQLEHEASNSEHFKCFIDSDDPVFSTPGDIPGRIRAFCKGSGQPVPQTTGEIIRCIYESLAIKYRMALASLEKNSGKHFDAIYIIGGGTKDKFLSAATSDACGRTVFAGPVEATVLGNIAVQLISSGEIASFSQARQVIADSFEQDRFEPKNTSEWDEAAFRYAKICSVENA